MHNEGRTILLDTHSMPIVTQYCERALLLHDGAIDTIGAPDLVAERYYDVNLSAMLARPDNTLPEMSSHIVAAISDPYARIIDAWLVDTAGQRTEVLDEGTRIDLRATVRVEQDHEEAGFKFQIAASDGRVVFTSDRLELGSDGNARAGSELEVVARVENRLPAGRYTVACDVYRGPDTPAGPTKVARLEVAGRKRDGSVILDHEMTVTELSRQQVSGR
jgi:lipopolysaccharide transport system ATP-binding protein